MKNWKKFYESNLKNYFSLIFFLLLFFTKTVNSNEIIIKGNEFTDTNVILSLIEENSDSISEDYSNYLLKTLDNSNYFKDVSVSIKDSKYIISVVEFPNIKKIYFDKNERLKDELTDQNGYRLNKNQIGFRDGLGCELNILRIKLTRKFKIHNARSIVIINVAVEYTPESCS